MESNRYQIDVAGERAHRNLVRSGVLPESTGVEEVIEAARVMFPDPVPVTRYLVIFVERGIKEAKAANNAPPAGGSAVLPGAETLQTIFPPTPTASSLRMRLLSYFPNRRSRSANSESALSNSFTLNSGQNLSMK